MEDCIVNEIDKIECVKHYLENDGFKEMSSSREHNFIHVFRFTDGSRTYQISILRAPFEAFSSVVDIYTKFDNLKLTTFVRDHPGFEVIVESQVARLGASLRSAA
jgi:type IV secretory pathway VirD2 relaxase